MKKYSIPNKKLFLTPLQKNKKFEMQAQTPPDATLSIGKLHLFRKIAITFTLIMLQSRRLQCCIQGILFIYFKDMSIFILLKMQILFQIVIYYHMNQGKNLYSIFNRPGVAGAVL